MIRVWQPTISSHIGVAGLFSRPRHDHHGIFTIQGPGIALATEALVIIIYGVVFARELTSLCIQGKAKNSVSFVKRFYSNSS